MAQAKIGKPDFFPMSQKIDFFPNNISQQDLQVSDGSMDQQTAPASYSDIRTPLKMKFKTKDSQVYAL